MAKRKSNTKQHSTAQAKKSKRPCGGIEAPAKRGANQGAKRQKRSAPNDENGSSDEENGSSEEERIKRQNTLSRMSLKMRAKLRRWSMLQEKGLLQVVMRMKTALMRAMR